MVVIDGGWSKSCRSSFRSIISIVFVIYVAVQLYTFYRTTLNIQIDKQSDSKVKTTAGQIFEVDNTYIQYTYMTAYSFSRIAITS